MRIVFLFLLLLLVAKEACSFSTTPSASSSSAKTVPLDKQPSCWYRNSSTQNKWRERIDFETLKIGQELQGIVVNDLLNGTSGPKLFLDVGVCRRKKHNTFATVNALLRLPRSKKMSVVQKRAARLRKQPSRTVFVSRLYRSEFRFEVVLEPLDATQQQQRTKPLLLSTSRLRPGDIVEATPVRYTDYGVLMRVKKYNRGGLLHIQTVADAYGRYVDKAAGLQQVLMGHTNNNKHTKNHQQQPLQLQVKSNISKRLFLDFTDSFKESLRPAAKKDKPVVVQQKEEEYDVSPYKEYFEETNNSAKEEEEEEKQDDNDYNDGYDEYDEDRDIEDALGLGTY